MDVLGVPAPGDGARAQRWWVALTVAGAVLAGLGAAAGDGATDSAVAAAVSSGGPAVRPAYQGHYVSPADVASLQQRGLATAAVINRELACQGIELYFDSDAERAAYLSDYGSRFPAEPPYLAGDPCGPYRDSPRYVADQ